MYATGKNLTTVINLLDAIKAFLEQCGWTTLAYKSAGGSYAKRLHMTKNGCYLHFYADRRASNGPLWNGGYESSSEKTGIVLTMGTGYNDANAWDEQAGVPINVVNNNSTTGVGCAIKDSVPIYAYYFFYVPGANGADAYYFIIEHQQNYFQHIAFCTVEKIGSWGGEGWAMSGSSQGCDAIGGLELSHGSSYSKTGPFTPDIHCGTMYFKGDIDTWIGKWYCSTQSINYNSGSTDRICVSSVINYGSWSFPSNFNRLPILNGLGAGRFFDQTREVSPESSNKSRRMTSTFNSTSILWPVYIFCVREPIASNTSDCKFSIVGRVPGMFYADMTNFGSRGVYTIGSDQYMVFPAWKKNTNNSWTNATSIGSDSGLQGVAIRYIP